MLWAVILNYLHWCARIVWLISSCGVVYVGLWVVLCAIGLLIVLIVYKHCIKLGIGTTVVFGLLGGWVRWLLLWMLRIVRLVVVSVVYTYWALLLLLLCFIVYY